MPIPRTQAGVPIFAHWWPDKLFMTRRWKYWRESGRQGERGRFASIENSRGVLRTSLFICHSITGDPTPLNSLDWPWKQNRAIDRR